MLTTPEQTNSHIESIAVYAERLLFEFYNGLIGRRCSGGRSIGIRTILLLLIGFFCGIGTHLRHFTVEHTNTTICLLTTSFPIVCKETKEIPGFATTACLIVSLPDISMRTMGDKM